MRVVSSVRMTVWAAGGAFLLGHPAPVEPFQVGGAGDHGRGVGGNDPELTLGLCQGGPDIEVTLLAGAGGEQSARLIHDPRLIHDHGGSFRVGIDHAGQMRFPTV